MRFVHTMLYVNLFYISFLLSLSLQPCPRCIGKVSQTSAPFFTEECYQNAPLSLDQHTTSTETLSHESDTMEKE